MRRMLITGLVVASVSVPCLVFPSVKTKEGTAEKFAKTIRAGSRIEVFSLEPNPQADAAAAKNVRKYHGYDVKGSVKLSANDDEQSESVKSVLDAMGKALIDRPKNAFKGCVFLPRHGLRVTSSGRPIDLVICLDCGDVDVGTKRYWLESSEKSGLRQVLNGALKNAGVELAKGAE